MPTLDEPKKRRAKRPEEPSMSGLPRVRIISGESSQSYDADRSSSPKESDRDCDSSSLVDSSPPVPDPDLPYHKLRVWEMLNNPDYNDCVYEVPPRRGARKSKSPAEPYYMSGIGFPGLDHSTQHSSDEEEFHADESSPRNQDLSSTDPSYDNGVFEKPSSDSKTLEIDPYLMSGASENQGQPDSTTTGLPYDDSSKTENESHDASKPATPPPKTIQENVRDAPLEPSDKKEKKSKAKKTMSAWGKICKQSQEQRLEKTAAAKSDAAAEKEKENNPPAPKKPKAKDVMKGYAEDTKAKPKRKAKDPKTKPKAKAAAKKTTTQAAGAPNDKVPDDKVPGGKVPGGKVPDEKVPDDKVPDDKVPDNQAPIDEVPEKKGLNQEAQTKETKACLEEPTPELKEENDKHLSPPRVETDIVEEKQQQRSRSTTPDGTPVKRKLADRDGPEPEGGDDKVVAEEEEEPAAQQQQEQEEEAPRKAKKARSDRGSSAERRRPLSPESSLFLDPKYQDKMSGPGVGFEYPRVPVAWLKRDVLLFANSIGCTNDELHFLYIPRNHIQEANKISNLTVAAFKHTSQEVVDFYAAQKAVTIPGVPNFDSTRVVDGQRRVEFLKPLPTTSAGKQFETRTKVLGVYDKGRPGSVVEIQTELVEVASGTVYSRETGSAFYIGQGNWGGPKGPATVNYPPPQGRKPDAVFEDQTTKQSALLYRLNGDYNPLHATPEPGKKMGFGGDIMHGLYSFNSTCHLLLKHLGGSDPANIKEYQARFASPVKPGDKLVTQVWRTGDVQDGWEEVRFVVSVEGGKVCLSNGRAFMKVVGSAKNKL
ncbi:uncharacterized protein E0L32_007854 [Thyridium curvatum]|uniref:Uncharacterized protein n=1 Tax=Thyridium curvatum TaxID=1093900 RepID=A0A507ALF4_9PEZI|nr:uncharacterized protein E0L32_007854 [Thyridium curvatum]TPX11435.1 hypothetical protein E0L32_007854 [Thyridium curvatum]